MAIRSPGSLTADLQPVALEEGHDVAVSCLSGVVEVDTMTSGWGHVRAGPVHWNIGVEGGENRSKLVRWVRAVAKAEWQVVRTVDDGNWVGVVLCRHGGSHEGEKLANGHSSLISVGLDENQRIKVGCAEELDLVTNNGFGHHVAVVEAREAVRLVLRGNLQVASRNESWHSSRVTAETGQDCSIERVWVHGSYSLGDDGTERVSNTDNLGEVGLSKHAFAKHGGQVVCDLDLKRGLHDVEAVRFVRLADAEAVVEESTVAVLNSSINVAVAWSPVPVVAVETDTVCQKLNARWLCVVSWNTVGSPNAVGA